MKFILIFFVVYFAKVNAQTDIEKVLAGGQILINGLSFLKGTKSNLTTNSNPKVIQSVCIKNKLLDKITFSLFGTDEDGNSIKKELVIQKDGKECVFDLPKGIYTYEIDLSNKEIYKKGEYKFNEEVTITVKDE